MLRHLNITIFGQVIGVSFRYEAKKKAEKCQITGFARNISELSAVYIEAEGSEKDLQDFLAWCHKGPFWAKVDRVETSEGEIKNYNSFDVIY